MPAGHGQLRREDQRPDLITVLANLPEVPALWFGQRRHGPIVDHQHVNPGQPRSRLRKLRRHESPPSRGTAQPSVCRTPSIVRGIPGAARHQIQSLHSCTMSSNSSARLSKWRSMSIRDILLSGAGIRFRWHLTSSRCRRPWVISFQRVRGTLAAFRFL